MKKDKIIINVIFILAILWYALCVAAAINAHNLSAVCGWGSALVVTVGLWFQDINVLEAEEEKSELERRNEKLLDICDDMREANHKLLSEAQEINDNNGEILRQQMNMLTVLNEIQEFVSPEDYAKINKKIVETGWKFAQVDGKWTLMVKNG